MPQTAAEHDARAGAVGGPVTDRREYTDVWSWTAPKYRIRARVLLIVNLVLYGGLCVFTHWLHVVRLFDFTWESYSAPFRFWGDQPQSLYDFVLYPISVELSAMHGVVIGLLFASIVAVPISVSILYRFRNALPFCALVLIFAHLPWMAITLVASCILAGVRPFRMSFRYASALVALLPILLYLYLGTRGAADTLGTSISPEQSLLRNAPWVLAILAASTMLALIIFIARIVRYRPGAVAPVMAVMFVTPVVLFHFYIGVDQLKYRVLALEYGPRAKRFEPVQEASEKIRAFVHEWTHPRRTRDARRDTVLALWSGDPRMRAALKHRISNLLLLELMQSRRAAYEACNYFIADHPDSRFVPNVLFIQARALDTRLDELRLVGENAQRELYTDFPHVQSEPVWTNLLTQYPHSPLALAARVRVAQLRLRQGDVYNALAALGAPGTWGASVAVPATQAAGPSPAAAAAPDETFDLDPQPYLLEAQRLHELIVDNVDSQDTTLDVEALQALASLDPHRAGYHDQLQRLAREFAESRLYPNLVMRWVMSHPELAQRRRLLEAFVQRFSHDDAVREAMFQLADLDLTGGSDEARRQRGVELLGELVERFPGTYWARLAGERLRLLAPLASPTTTPAEAP